MAPLTRTAEEVPELLGTGLRAARVGHRPGEAAPEAGAEPGAGAVVAPAAAGILLAALTRLVRVTRVAVWGRGRGRGQGWGSERFTLFLFGFFSRVVRSPLFWPREGFNYPSLPVPQWPYRVEETY